jgi:phenylacetate-CoA ligase
VSEIRTELPTYHTSVDWDAFFAKYPPPDVFERTVYRWPRERLREFQNARFLELMEIGWRNEFYRRRWAEAGIQRGDIRSIDNIGKLPTYTSDDVKNDQAEHPPFGHFHGDWQMLLATAPIKVQTSGGTTGKPRATLYGPIDWEMNGLTQARAMYVQGVRPGDVVQIPATCSLANLGWCVYKACHDYLGVLPLTTGSGIVTSSRRQLELAFDWGTNVWCSFPEYLTQLAKVCRDELGRDIRELKTKSIHSFLGPDTENTLRAQLEDVWGCPVYDEYGTNEMGGAAFECQHKNGLHVMEDCIYLEIESVETGRPVADGETGNMVVTILHRGLPPVIRYNVRDLARIVSTERCACGGGFRRMDKFLGRSDDMVKLRGVNLYPMACLPAIKSDPRTTGEWICIVDRYERDGVIRDEMTIKVEVSRGVTSIDGLREHLEKRLQSDLGVKVAVELVDEGSLADVANVGREGKAKRLLDRRHQKRPEGMR